MPSEPHVSRPPDRPSDILVPSFERELLRMTGNADPPPRVRAFLDEDLRLAVLFSSGRALIPAPGYFETACGFEVVRRFGPSLERGQLALLGSGGRPAEYAARKQSHWAEDPQLLDQYSDQARIEALDSSAWKIKLSSTDEALVAEWTDAVSEGTHPLGVLWKRAGVSASAFEQLLVELPQALEGQAVLVDNVRACLPEGLRRALSAQDIQQLRVFLARGFFTSYLAEQPAALIDDARVGGQGVTLPPERPTFEATRLRGVLQPTGLADILLTRLTHAQVAWVRDRAVWLTLSAKLLDRYERQPSWEARELTELRDLNPPRLWVSAKAQERQIEGYLFKVLDAIERGARSSSDFRAGGARQRGSFTRQLKEKEPMGMNFEGPAQGAFINIEGDVNVGAASKDDWAAVLRQVLTQTNPDDAEALARKLDELAAGRSVTREEVETVVKNELTPEAQKTPKPVRERLLMFGTSASAGVASQGIVAAFRALIGGG